MKRSTNKQASQRQAAPKAKSEPRKHRYTDAEKAAALVVLDFCEGNVTETTRRTGVPESTLSEWRDGRINDAVPAIRDEKRKSLADSLEELAFKYVEGFLKTAGDVSARDAIALGIVIDKMQILRGAPDSISKSLSADPEARRARILELVKQAA